MGSIPRARTTDTKDPDDCYRRTWARKDSGEALAAFEARRSYCKPDCRDVWVLFPRANRGQRQIVVAANSLKDAMRMACTMGTVILLLLYTIFAEGASAEARADCLWLLCRLLRGLDARVTTGMHVTSAAESCTGEEEPLHLNVTMMTAEGKCAGTLHVNLQADADGPEVEASLADPLATRPADRPGHAVRCLRVSAITTIVGKKGHKRAKRVSE